MSKAVVVPLESYKLIGYARSLDCYICDGQNNFNAEFCHHCAAPMALAHQAAHQKTHPRMIAVVGASSAGKTVYLGMLMDMLFRRRHGFQILARGAFSIDLQETSLAALARSRFPEKTPNEPDRWNWVHCQIRRKKRRQGLELIVPDMSGEAVLEEVNHPHSSRIIRSFMEKCCGVIVLIDVLRVEEGRRDEEFFSMKLVSYVADLQGNGNGKATRGKKPVALVFTKADQCDPCRQDPSAYAESRAAGLWGQCRQQLKVHRFFATGVAGACATYQRLDGNRVRVPLRIEPHGVVEPFDWLLDNLKW